jgi:hypothetical protein
MVWKDSLERASVWRTEVRNRHPFAGAGASPCPLEPTRASVSRRHPCSRGRGPRWYLRNAFSRTANRFADVVAAQSRSRSSATVIPQRVFRSTRASASALAGTPRNGAAPPGNRHRGSSFAILQRQRRFHVAVYSVRNTRFSWGICMCGMRLCKNSTFIFSAFFASFPQKLRTE